MDSEILSPSHSEKELLSRLAMIFGVGDTNLLPADEELNKNVRNFEDEVYEKISKLSQNNKEALDLIAYIYRNHCDINHKKLLQEKLIFLGYDECSGFVLPKDFDKDLIIEGIINYYNSIDFDFANEKMISFQEKIINNAIREFF